MRRSYPQLDTLRAIAAFAVVGTHTSFWAGFYTHGLLGTATQRLEVGVAIFFVLSGFLLGRPYLETLASGRRHDSVGRYFWKRALRILPVYWVCAIAALVLLEPNRSLGFDRWINTLALTDLYFSSTLPTGLTQMWSLSTEVAFYVILPLLMAGIVHLVCRKQWRPGRIVAVLLVLCVLNLVWSCAAAGSVDTFGGWAHRWLLNYMSWFALGIFVAVLTIDHASPRLRMTSTFTAIAKDRAACWGAALALFVIVSTPIAGTPLLVAISPSETLARTVLYGLIAVLLVLPCVLGDESTLTARVMSHPVSRHLGHISYSVFCCHVILLELIAPKLGFGLFEGRPIALFFTLLIAAIAVSEVLYRVVELPFMRLKSWRSNSSAPTKTPKVTPTSS